MVESTSMISTRGTGSGRKRAEPYVDVSAGGGGYRRRSVRGSFSNGTPLTASGSQAHHRAHFANASRASSNAAHYCWRPTVAISGRKTAGATPL
jgi:hypothetical protein